MGGFTYSYLVMVQHWPFWLAIPASGLVAAGSYGSLAEKVFRLGHMGAQADMDWMEKALNVIAEAL